jgi:hypothetical protein
MSAMGEDPRNGGKPQNAESQFERFERFTRQLVSVPKAEIDALGKKRKRRRSPKPRT